MQGLVGRQQMVERRSRAGDAVAGKARFRVDGDEIVDPSHGNRRIREGLDGVGGIVELRSGIRRDRRHRIGRGAVAPDGRRGERVTAAVQRVPDPAGQDLLFELPHRDVIAVGHAVGVHDRGNHERRHEFGNREWVEGPAGRRLRRGDRGREEQNERHAENRALPLQFQIQFQISHRIHSHVRRTLRCGGQQLTSKFDPALT